MKNGKFTLVRPLFLAVLLLFLLGPGSARGQGEIQQVVDGFDTPQLPPLTLTFPGDLNQTDDSSVAGAGILGGERDLEIQMTGGNINNSTLTASVDSNVLFVECGPLVTGVIRAVWDGVDGSPVIDFTGLGIDLTAAGTYDRFRLGIQADDLPATVTIRVYSDATNHSTRILNLPGGIVSTNYDLYFSDFTGTGGSGANFANVGAVVLEIQTQSQQGALDLALDFLVVVGNAPPPSPLASKGGGEDDDDDDDDEDVVAPPPPAAPPASSAGAPGGGPTVTPTPAFPTQLPETGYLPAGVAPDRWLWLGGVGLGLGLLLGWGAVRRRR